MANKSFQVSIDFIGNVSDLQSKLKQVSGEINKIGNTAGGAAVQKQFNSLTQAAANLQTRLSQPIKTQADFNKINSEVQKIEMGYSNLRLAIERLQGASDAKKLELLPADQQSRIKSAESALKSYETAMDNAAKKTTELKRAQEQLASEKGRQQTANQNIIEYTEEVRKASEELKRLQETQAELEGKKNIAKSEKSSFESKSRAEAKKGNDAAAAQYAEKAAQATARYRELEGQISTVEAKIKTASQSQQKFNTLLNNAKTQANDAAQQITRITSEINAMGGGNTQALQNAFATLRGEAEKLNIDLNNIGKDATEANINALVQRMRELGQNGVQQADQALIKMANTLNSQVVPSINKTSQSAQQAQTSFNQFMTAQQDIDQLANRAKQFFTLSNGINLFKRTIQNAMKTIKELDSVMTETAVVTDFSIGDMWNKLPEYSTKASQLGASIKDLYSATTLYYQQGLNSEQAMGIGVETMKMARIAGMDASEATQAMTAALRGFNMEINEMSATKVNDVYSELAAITASDTAQIATAMSKTASIAANANMEFETTAALLAQIIETTQEAPETAGTAMKTIIARFSEVKSLFDEGMLSGKDSEGEEININKIDTALKKVGISLNDFLTGQKGIDDIFLELASKWDTLDLATQRYIATTAAGSRQQSRFIAMMSDYDRTMELVSAANNSAGASEEQFGKTLESMEAKLQKLKNAWSEFTMSIANSDVIKLGIDLLTKLLQTINQLTSSLSGGGGLVKSFLSLATIGGALGVGKKLLGNFFGFASNSMGIPQVIAAASGQPVQNIQGAMPAAAPLFGNPFVFNPMAATSMMYGPTSMLGTGLGNFINRFTPTRGQMDASLRQSLLEETAVMKELEASKNHIDPTQYYNEHQNQSLKINGLQQQARQKYIPTEQEKAISMQKGHMASGIATGVGILASGLSTVARNNGNEKLADGLQAVGTTGIIAGQGINVMNHALALAGTTWGAFGQALVSILPVLGPVALGVAAIGAAAFAMYKMSPEGQLKDAEKRTKEISKGAEQAAQSYDKLTNSLKSIENQEKALEDMTYGTDEWRQATNKLNQDTLNLIEENPYLVEEGFVEKDGEVLKISEEGKEALLEKEAKEKTQAESARLGAELTEERLRKNTITSDDFMGAFQGAMKTITAADGTQTQVRDEESNRKIADLIASGELKTASEAQDWANKNLGEGISINITDKTFSDLKDYGFARQTQDMKIAEAERQVAQNIKSIAEQKGTADELSKDLDTDLISAMREDVYDKKSWSETLTKEEYEQYADMMGYKDYDGRQFLGMGKARFIDAEGQVQKISTGAIKEALASVQADEDTAEKIGKIDEVFGKDITDKSIANQALSEDGKNITSTTLSNLKYKDKDGNEISLINSDGKVKEYTDLSDATNMEEALGWEPGKMKELADQMGIELNQLYNTIAENIESGSDRITDQRKDLVQNMNKYSNQYDEAGKKIAGESELNANTLRTLEESYGESFRGTLEGVFSSLERSGDSALISAGYSNFLGQAVAGKDEVSARADVEELAEYINGINWANPIESMNQLNDTIANGTGLAKQFAQSIKDSNSAFLGAGSQMRFFATSEDFAGVKEEIGEIVESQGELSADNVLELADSYKSLGKIMENTGIKAGGMAKILESLSKGDIELSQLTDSVMAAMKNFDSLGSLIAETQKRLDEFDAGLDEGFVYDFIGKSSKTISSLIEQGAYGNSQLDSYADFYLGDNWNKNPNESYKSQEEQKEILQQLQKFVERNSEDMGAAWVDLYQRNNPFTGEEPVRTEQQQKAVDDKWANSGMQITEKDGYVNFVGYEKYTAEQQSQFLQDFYGLTKEVADMMLTDWKNFNLDYAQHMEGLERDQIIKDVLENKGYKQNEDGTFTQGEQGKGVIDKSEIAAIETMTGHTGLTQDLTSQGIIVSDYYDESGQLKIGADLFAEMANVRNQLKNRGSLFTEETTQEERESVGQDFFKNNFGRTAATVQRDVDNKRSKDEARNYLATLEENDPEYEATKKLAEAPVPISLDLNEAQKQMAELGLPPEFANDAIQSMVDSLGEGESMQVDVELSDGSTETIALQAGDSLAAATAKLEEGVKNAELATAIQSAFANNPIPVEIAPNQDDLNNLTGNITLNPTLNNNNQFSGTITLKPILAWTGFAKGVKNSPHTQDAMVGEKGPELIERQDGTAYLSGTSGPEITRINKGDTVYTAEETKSIFGKNKGYSMPRYEGGHTVTETKTSGHKIPGTGSGGGNKNDKTNVSVSVEFNENNSFDRLYNVLEEIEKLTREREKLERRYQRLLDRQIGTARELYEYSKKQADNLRDQAEQQKEVIAGRKSEIDDILERNKEYQKYGTIDKETGQITINWDLINTVKSEDEQKKIEEYIKKLEEMRDSMRDAEDALEDIEDDLWEIEQRGAEEYMDFEERVKEAIMENRQKEIDELEKINESINDTNSKLLDSIQSSIDKVRQDRENEKTETDLQEKQRRLAYLKQDTSGANAAEIMDLEKEIREGQEDYTDSLIDQKINELREQNDKAAEQREQQIAIMQSQLDWYEQSGAIWEEVSRLIEEGIDYNGDMITGSELEDVLKSAENWKGLSELGQMRWLRELETQVAQAMAWMTGYRQLETIGGMAGKEISFTDGSGTTRTGTVDEQGNVAMEDGSRYTEVYQAGDGTYHTGETEATAAPEQEETYPYGKASEVTTNLRANKKETVQNAAVNYALNKLGYDTDEDSKKFDSKTTSALKDFQFTEGLAESKKKANGKVDLATKAVFKFRKYKTGGIADFTGPAWLDGTKSRPELVLNQRDTQNFIQLKDILSSIMTRNFSSTQSPTENNGDITYDIDINVETVGSDYDVEQVANKVKSMINEDARYRNNNAISLKR